MPIFYNSDLKEMDEKYTGRMIECVGPLLMGFPDGGDSSRQNMFTSNLKQILVIHGAEFPRIYTGLENLIGKRNKAYLKIKGEWKVLDKIYKYGPNSIYTLVLYNEELDKYDMIEKKPVEDLTERFGYEYDTSVMDSLQPGDIIKDKIISKSLSYDKDMNYCLGINAKAMYITDPSTQEDSIYVRRGWLDKFSYDEADTAKFNMNLNYVPLNLYGDDEHYQGFPHIGQEINNGTIAAFRQINYDNILTSFQSKYMSEISSSDKECVTTKNAILYDIDIYSNNTEGLPDNVFYQQIRQYIAMQSEYADRITKWCKQIKKSGSEYTRRVTEFKDKYQHWNDPDRRWKDKDKSFDNILIKFKTIANVKVGPGCKLTGRYGDKGVCSRISNAIKNAIVENILDYNYYDENDLDEEKIMELVSKMVAVDDSDMPFLEDGTPIDIILNSSGAIRR